jgi:hypothetical protein
MEIARTDAYELFRRRTLMKSRLGSIHLAFKNGVFGHERMIRRISQRNAYATQMVCGEPAFKAPVPRIGETEHSETELWTIARA